MIGRVATRVAIVVACAVAAIAVNLTILHRTPSDPIGRTVVVVSPAPSTTAP